MIDVYENIMVIGVGFLSGIFKGGWAVRMRNTTARGIVVTDHNPSPRF